MLKSSCDPFWPCLFWTFNGHFFTRVCFPLISIPQIRPILVNPHVSMYLRAFALSHELQLISDEVSNLLKYLPLCRSSDWAIWSFIMAGSCRDWRLRGGGRRFLSTFAEATKSSASSAAVISSSTAFMNNMIIVACGFTAGPRKSGLKYPRVFVKPRYALSHILETFIDVKASSHNSASWGGLKTYLDSIKCSYLEVVQEIRSIEVIQRY